MRKRFEDRMYDDGFWFIIFHPFVCPACYGEGGWGGDFYEPYEPCLFCKDKGYVGLWAKMLTLNGWFLDGVISNIKYRRELKKKEKP